MNIQTTVAKKIIIVGGVAGGMSAAARIRRLSEKSQVIVFERSGHVSYANCGLPYYIGREIKSEESLLLQTPDGLKQRFNLDVRVHSEVIDINTTAKTVSVRNTQTNESYSETYDELILAVGAAPIRPELPGINLPGVFTLRSVEDVQTIENWIEQKQAKNAVIVGGGFIGLEIAEQLKNRGLDVTLIDSGPQVLAPLDPEMANLVHQALSEHGIKLKLSSPLKELRPATGTNTPLSCFVMAGEHQPIPSDLVILGLGIRPEITLAKKANLEIGERGGIIVNEYLQTKVPNIWAVGDAIEVIHPVNKKLTRIALGGPANRQGRIAAANIFGKEVSYDGTYGTAIIRVFELTIALVGLNESQLKQSQITYEKTYLHPSQHAGYFPGAKRLDMKMLFDKASGEIFGAQIIGKEGVDKRIDVIATAMKAKMTVEDLAELELAYAPPFGSAKDPINLLGMIASNVREGILQQIQWDELAELPDNSYCILDVRSTKEREAGFIPGSKHISLTELRAKLDKLPRDKTIVTYCQSGQRSYYAFRYLTQQGFSARSLSGGYLTWSAAAYDKKSKIKSAMPPSMVLVQ